MSGTKYSFEDKAQLQDPEAILTIGSAIEEESTSFNSSTNSAESTRISGATYKNEFENTNPNKLEYPKLTINGKETSGTMITIEPNLLHSKAHAFSEPDLKQANLYKITQKWESPLDVNDQGRGQRRKGQKTGMHAN